MDEQTSKGPKVTFERRSDFRAEYANNTRYESTVYDLTVVFGQSDLGSGHEVIKQHTAITVPWAAVKLAKYYLEVNLLFHESANGKVQIPPSQIPDPLPVPNDEISQNPSLMSAYESIKRLREEFIASL
jgi:hypothetical protein